MKLDCVSGTLLSRTVVGAAERIKGVGCQVRFFWQPLPVPESSALAAFLTPFGRYRLNVLPFGKSSRPEHFQRQMSTLSDGRRRCYVASRQTDKQHDHRLRKTLTRLQQAGIKRTLNQKRWMFNETYGIWKAKYVRPHHRLFPNGVMLLVVWKEVGGRAY